MLRPVAAAEWILTQPDSDDREFAHRSLINAWARQDASAAEAWLESQPPSSSRDAALGEYVNVMASQEPQQALKMSRQSAETEQREAAMELALQGILWRDTKQAALTIAALTLSSAARDRLNQKAEEFAAWKRLAGSE